MLVAVLALVAMLACTREGNVETVSLAGLAVDYMETPLGIDNPEPRFSWKMDGNLYALEQKSWRVTVTEQATGRQMWDSGTVPGEISVGILYAGEPLAPCTRYVWAVEVTDAQDRTVTASSWFETGLMDSGWSGAQWISGGVPHFSKYRSQYDLSFDLSLPASSPEADLLFSWLSSDYFGRMQLRREDGRLMLALYFTAGGSEKLWAEYPVKWLPASGDISTRMTLSVNALDYALGYRISVLAGDRAVNPEPVVIRPFPETDWKVQCRFYQIGFSQPEGSPATFSNITVTERVWDSTLYESDTVYAVEGGQSTIVSPAEETGAPILRKTFTTRGQLASARLYTTARGIYEYEINGKRLGEDWFNPGSTDYRYRILYNTYDITPLMKKGNNAVSATLGAGWYSDFTGFATSWQDQYGTELSLLGKIVLTYSDGTSETIVTDGSWKAFNHGPVLSDSFQNGEDYDARREVGGASDPRLDDSLWEPASVVEAPGEDVLITYYVGLPVRNHLTLTAVSVSEPRPGVFVYDMGQNMVGVPRIRLRGDRGTEVTFRYGEMIYPLEVPEDPLPPLTAADYSEMKGLAYNQNYRGALATDHYILKGGGTEVFQPHFTFHGFRYIEIHGLTKALPLADVEGLVLESVGDCLSGFETSEPLVNRLYQNIVWGQRGNFLSIPTDCPQRDERLGWTGDAQVFARAATTNMNVEPFFSRWFQSVRDIQAADGSYPNIIPNVSEPPAGAGKGGGAMSWMDAGVIIPWQMYLQYGDVRFLEEHYPSMKSYMGYLQQRAVGDIQPGTGFGDWVALEHTNTPLTNTAYWAYDAMLMEKMASALGKYAEAAQWKELYERIKKAFNREFVGIDGVTKETKNVPAYSEWIAGGADSKFKANTQTSYVVPLQADLFDSAHKPLAVQNLVENVASHGYTLTTGFIGTPYICLVLSREGFDEVAYKLFEQRNFPSWLYPVLQGATTMWERWNSYTIKNGFGPVDMNSFNHYSFGAIEEWMFSYMLGIRPLEDDPGYHGFELNPRPGGTLSFARGHYDSVYGRIESAWHRLDDGAVRYDFTVPANTHAALTLPVTDGSVIEVIRGEGYAEPAGAPGRYSLPSGKYTFIVR